jgi:hypothetical protein
LAKEILIIISLEFLVYDVVYLIVTGLIFWLLWRLLAYCNVPEPFNKVARVLLAILAALVVINVLLDLVGMSLFRWH